MALHVCTIALCPLHAHRSLASTQHMCVLLYPNLLHKAFVSCLQQMTAAAVAREKAKLYAEFGRRGGEEEGLADDLAPQEFLELEELRKK